MNKAVIHGTEGSIRWGYRSAATLGPWTLTAEGPATSITAKVVTHDACAVSQQPLTFVVVRPKGQKWVWPIQLLQIVDGTLTASVGPLQE